MATTWTPIASVVQTTIPNDITGNSLSLAPVSGDSNAVALKLGNGSSTLFGVDASGNVSAAAASLSGTLAVTGTTTLGAASVTSMTNSGQMTAKNAQVSGNGTAAAPAYSFTAQTDTGPYLATASTSAAVLGFAVNGTQALSMTKSGISVPGTLSVTGTTTLGNATVGNLTTSGLTNTGSGTAAGLFSSISGTASAPSFSYTNQTDTGLYLATQSASAAALALAVNGTQALSLAKGGISVPGTLGVTGATTLAATSTGALTVSGNESVSGTLSVTGSSALGTVTTGALTATSLAATSLGPVTSPSHTFSGQTDTGLYLPTQSTSAAILGLAVNGTQSLSLSKAGVTVPGTLNVTGATTLSGNTSFGGTLTSSGNFTANALFASATGSASAPVISNSSYTSTGIYFSSTPALVFTAGGTAVASMNASSMNVAQTLNAQGAFAVTGNSTHAGTSSVTGAATFGSTVNVSGTTTLAALSSGAITSSAAIQGTALTISASGGKLTFGDGTTQTTAASGGNPGSSATFSATSAGTAAAPAFTFSTQTDTGMWLNTASTSAAVLGFTVNGTQAFNLTKSLASFNNLSTGGTLSSQSTVTGTSFLTSTTSGSNTAVQFGTTSANTGMYLNPSSPYVGLAAGGVKVIDASSTAVTMPLATTFSTTTTFTGASTHNAAVQFNSTASHTGTVTSTTAAGTPSFVSSQGFRHSVKLGNMYVTSTTANQSIQCQEVAIQPGTTTIVAAKFSQSMATSGSILSIVVDALNSISSSMTVQLNKNGSAISGASVTVSSGSFQGVVSFNKGTYTFASGDNIYATITFASATSSQTATIFVRMDVETGA